MTQEYLKTLFNYDEDSGIVTHKYVPKYSKNKVGNIAGYFHKKTGYIKIMISGKSYQMHRLIWIMIHGTEPKNIDHINGKRSDNSKLNLRSVSSAENSKNMKKSKANTSGKMGVYWRKDNQRWMAVIFVDMKRVYLGQFAEYSDAVNARKNAEVLYGYHENHEKEL